LTRASAERGNRQRSQPAAPQGLLVCLGGTAYRSPTHVKSLSRHKTAVEREKHKECPFDRLPIKRTAQPFICGKRVTLSRDKKEEPKANHESLF